MNTALSLADIDAQLTQQKSAIKAANDAVSKLQAQRVDVFVQTAIPLSNDAPYEWNVGYRANINIYAGYVQGGVEIDTGHLEYAADIEEYDNAFGEIDDMWLNMQRASERARNSDAYLVRAIYSDLDPEEAASCYWVFALKAGGCVVLSYSNDNENADYFKAMVDRYLHTVSKAYRITVEDNLC